jgi:hypothetical protein
VALQRRRLRRAAGQVAADRPRLPQGRRRTGRGRRFNYRGEDLDAAGIADCNTAAKP